MITPSSSKRLTRRRHGAGVSPTRSASSTAAPAPSSTSGPPSQATPSVPTPSSAPARGGPGSTTSPSAATQTRRCWPNCAPSAGSHLPGPSTSPKPTARPGRLPLSDVLLAALGGPDRQRNRADDEQATEEHEAGCVICLPEHDGGDADRGSGNTVGNAARLPRCQLEQKAGSSQKGSGENEVEHTPVHFVGDLHRHQGQQQYECCHERDAG